jgi:hypothetical protein
MTILVNCKTSAAIFISAHRCLGQQMFLTTTYNTFLSPSKTQFLKRLGAGLSRTEIYPETCATVVKTSVCLYSTALGIQQK